MERWAIPATPDSEDVRFPSPAPPEDFIYEELLTRTSWCNADYGYRQIERGRAEGNKAALWLRSKIQSLLFTLGCYLQLHSGKAIFLGIVLLGTFAVGLKSAHVETNVQKLWVEVGGRLQRELEYTERTLGVGVGQSNQLVLQTSRQPGADLLNRDAMLQHLESVRLATQVKVSVHDKIWTFRDVCYIPAYPSYEESFIDGLIEPLMPCTIVTPLDCFWDGAKLLGPEHPLSLPGIDEKIDWTNLDLVEILEYYNTTYPVYREMLTNMANMIDSMGVGRGYLERPCLNPTDPDCPDIAPNKASMQVPNIGETLTGGCQGFARKLMEWPEEMIVGGVSKNSSGYINRAEALQTVIQLRGEKDMYESWKNNQKVGDIRWSREKAITVLEEWQRKFTEVVRNSTLNGSGQEVNAFSSTALNDLMADFSETSSIRVILGYSIMVIYAFLTMVKVHDGVASQGGVGLCGVLLVTGSVAAALGFCAWIRLVFNSATTQVLPFLALGVGVDDMFLLAHSSTSIPSEIPFVYYTGEVLRRAGVSVLLSSCINICGFLSAAVVPIPALRSLAFQLAIILAFNLLVMLFIFPAVLALDAERREMRRVDILCCITRHVPSRVIRVQPRPLCGGQAPYTHRAQRPPAAGPTRVEIEVQSAIETVTTTTDNNPRAHNVTVVHPHPSMGPAQGEGMTPVYDTPPSTAASNRALVHQNSFIGRDQGLKLPMGLCKFWRWNLSSFAKDHYGPLLGKKYAQIPVLLFFGFLLAASIYGILQMEDGLELDDVIPQGTPEADFLATQSRYFSYYDMYIVSEENFDYPHHQRQLYALHREVANLENVVRRPDGGLQKFWLEIFREWLIYMQAAFDQDKYEGRIIYNSWYQNATDDGVLAYKMMIQTGHSIDTGRFLDGRLVDSQGIIYPGAFYKYLTVWYNYEFISVAATQGNFRPTPPSWTPGGKTEKDVSIPTSQRLNYTQLPFYLINLRETNDILSLLRRVRNISDYFTSVGVPNYPRGVPFTFWEQYLNLRQYLLMAMACVLGGTFVIVTLLLVNPWAALILVFVLGMISVELLGFMGLIGLKLSAIPVVTLIISVGVGVEFTLHVCYAFLTAVGDREHRVTLALEHTLAPVLDGGLSTLLGVLMLAGAEFMFIINYFFYVFLALIILGLLNGLVLLPVLLVLFGPPGEIISPENGNRLRTPTPPPTPPLGRNVRMGQLGRSRHAWDTPAHDQGYARDHIEVHPPELVVETTRCDLSAVNQQEPVTVRPPPTAPRRHHQPTRGPMGGHRPPQFSHPHIPHYTTTTSSSSSGGSPQLAGHVTTVTATSRVAIIHGIPCTVVERPRERWPPAAPRGKQWDPKGKQWDPKGKQWDPKGGVPQIRDCGSGGRGSERRGGGGGDSSSDTPV